MNARLLVVAIGAVLPVSVGAQNVAMMEAERALANQSAILDAPESPVSQPFNDRSWMLKEDMRYTIGRSGKTITIPKGFVTDFASIPRVFWLLLPPTGSYSRAAVVHDWLYWVQVCTRDQSDNLLLLAMEESNVGGLTRGAVYRAVSEFGGSAWRGNANERRNGFIRMLLAPHDVIQGNTKWSEYREQLRSLHVGEAPRPTNIEFCRLGNSAQIPM